MTRPATARRRGTSRSPLRLVLALSLLSSVSPLGAQRLPRIRTHLGLAHSFYNPASLSAEVSAPTIAILYGTHTSDEKYYLISTATPLPLKQPATSSTGVSHTLGAQLIQDQQSFLTLSLVSARYALGTALGAHHLSLGIEGHLQRLSFDAEKATTEGIVDESLPSSKVEGKTFDLSVGLSYRFSNFRLEVAAGHLLSPAFSLGEQYRPKLPKQLSVFATQRIPLMKQIELSPFAFVLREGSEWTRVEGGLSASYRKWLTLSGGYRTDRSWMASAALALGSARLIYSYEQLRPSSHPLHEVSLQYQLPSLARTVPQGRTPSIRLL